MIFNRIKDTKYGKYKLFDIINRTSNYCLCVSRPPLTHVYDLKRFLGSIRNTRISKINLWHPSA